MLVRILKSQTEKHVDRDLGTILCESGLAEEIVRDGGARPQEVKCEIQWTLGPRSTDPKLSLLSYSCPVCGISGTGLGQLGARQLAEKPPYHRGKLAPPPPELVKQAFGQPGYALAASMVSMQQGYSGSTTPWTYTLADELAAKEGKTPVDKPAAGIPAVYLGDVNSI